MEKMWNIDELAAYFNVSKSNAYRISRQPDFPRTLVGNQVRFVPVKVSKWVDSHTTALQNLVLNESTMQAQ
jgi:predicted DNA-binding transcriptional regulator AlpA